jgi:hypothetical protein
VRQVRRCLMPANPEFLAVSRVDYLSARLCEQWLTLRESPDSRSGMRVIEGLRISDRLG